MFFAKLQKRTKPWLSKFLVSVSELCLEILRRFFFHVFCLVFTYFAGVSDIVFFRYVVVVSDMLLCSLIC